MKLTRWSPNLKSLYFSWGSLIYQRATDANGMSGQSARFQKSINRCHTLTCICIYQHSSESATLHNTQQENREPSVLGIMSCHSFIYLCYIGAQTHRQSYKTVGRGDLYWTGGRQQQAASVASEEKRGNGIYIIHILYVKYYILDSGQILENNVTMNCEVSWVFCQRRKQEQ